MAVEIVGAFEGMVGGDGEVGVGTRGAEQIYRCLRLCYQFASQHHREIGVADGKAADKVAFECLYCIARSAALAL